MLWNYHHAFCSCLSLEHGLICKIMHQIWTFKFHKVVWQHISGVVGNVTYCFVGNLTDFPAVKNFQNQLKIWHNYRHKRGGDTFFKHSVNWMVQTTDSSAVWLVFIHLGTLWTTESSCFCMKEKITMNYQNMLLHNASHTRQHITTYLWQINYERGFKQLISWLII